jgi:hypothetical protein
LPELWHGSNPGETSVVVVVVVVVDDNDDDDGEI